jgi:bifunctional UDP-N-acetylglucosamine pyrophosphorylase / glucosamine-1-phosphate N-acetyltransferase
MVHVVILAAGKGTRMKSDLPKVLHQAKGVSLIERLLRSVTKINAKPTIIVGYGAEEVKKATGNKYHYIEQKEQLGTGHAVMIAKQELKDKNIKHLVVLLGDQPLITVETINKLVENHTKSDAAMSLATVKVEEGDPTLMIFNNFGRIVRDIHGKVDRIVEFKDATTEERELKEFNPSFYCFDAEWLWENIVKLGSNNAAKEYYLTDMVHLAKEQGAHIDSYVITNPIECLGVNTPEQLKMVEEAIQE